MLSLTHTIISLPFAIYLQNPALIFAAAFTFHLLADTIPHWNIFPDNFKRYPYGWVALDITAGLLAAWYITGSNVLTLPVLAAIAGGNAPDVLQGLWDIAPQAARNYFRWAQPFFIWHDKLQLETSTIWYGLLWQIIAIGVAVMLI